MLAHSTPLGLITFVWRSSRLEAFVFPHEQQSGWVSPVTVRQDNKQKDEHISLGLLINTKVSALPNAEHYVTFCHNNLQKSFIIFHCILFPTSNRKCCRVIADTDNTYGNDMSVSSLLDFPLNRLKGSEKTYGEIHYIIKKVNSSRVTTVKKRGSCPSFRIFAHTYGSPTGTQCCL